MPHRYRRYRRYSTFSLVLSAYRKWRRQGGTNVLKPPFPIFTIPNPLTTTALNNPHHSPFTTHPKNHRNPSSSPSNPLPHHLHLPVYVYTVTPLIVPPLPPKRTSQKQSTHLPHRCSPSSDTLLAPQGAGSASRARTRCSCQCLHRGRWFRLTRRSF